jgi:hypothetical protein
MSIWTVERVARERFGEVEVASASLSPSCAGLGVSTPAFARTVPVPYCRLRQIQIPVPDSVAAHSVRISGEERQGGCRTEMIGYCIREGGHW